MLLRISWREIGEVAVGWATLHTKILNLCYAILLGCDALWTHWWIKTFLSPYSGLDPVQHRRLHRLVDFKSHVICSLPNILD